MATIKSKNKVSTRTRSAAIALVSEYIGKLTDQRINFSLRHQRGWRYEFTVNADCDLTRHLFPEFDIQPTTCGRSRFAILEIRYNGQT